MYHKGRGHAGRGRLQQTFVQVAHLYQLLVVETLLRRKALAPSVDGRHIPLRVSGAPLVDERRGHAYIANTVHSSRYSLLDFLPRQLWFQSTRLHNLFFICIGVPQCISGLSTTGNFTTILPLLVFMCLTILKEGYDDYRRHRLDQVENKSLATVLKSSSEAGARGRWLSRSALRRLPGLRPKPPCVVEDLDATDELQWQRTEWRSISVGDILYVRRDEPLPADVVLLYADGEDGLCYIETMNLDGETNLKSRRSPPCLRQCQTLPGIQMCDATITCQDPSPDLHGFNGKMTVNGGSHALTLENVIFRSCVLRNTPYAIVLVIRTGEECSIRMNANHHLAAKKPRLEKFADQAVITLIIYVILITAGLSIGYMLWQHRYEHVAFYVRNAPVGYQEVIVGYGIMFNNVIPLALYVSLEIVRIGQMLLLNADGELYDAVTDTPMRCNTNTILENLGQVTHILTDKTGTLTENVMRLRKISFAGTKWNHVTKCEASAEVVRSPTTSTDSSESPQVVLTDGVEEEEVTGRLVKRSVSTHRPTLGVAREANGTTTDLMDVVAEQSLSPLAQEARQFLLGLALCHTCLPELRDGTLDFQAASPDEVALVRAAQELGFSMVERSSKAVTLLVRGQDGSTSKETYEILDIIEFSSNRKRMSVVLRCPDDTIWLICKGADNVLLPLLKDASVAADQAQVVRKSVEADRRRYRKSLQEHPRTSLGARVSFDSMSRPSYDQKSPSPIVRPVATRARSFETKHRLSQLRHSLEVRPASFDAYPMKKQRASLQVPGSDTLPGSCAGGLAVTDTAATFKRCFEDIDQYASEGLRTLLFTHRSVSQEEYEAWRKLYGKASTSLTDREEQVEAAGALIEQSLDLLGVTAIEDKLQQDVPETIEKLARVVKIFCLTGDKRETAISIAHSAKICKPESDVFILDVMKDDLEVQMQDTAVALESDNTHSVLVVDGRTLAALDADPSLSEHFYALVAFIDSVICCRVSPAQKAGVVQGIRASNSEALTLAIGDGSNDIAMIQAAHVGVGISGKEGLQAYRAADYSIAQFRFLQRLLLVHGRWNYVRTSRFILLTFWKEMFFYLPQALYQPYNGYTGSSLYESWSLTVLNTLFTSLCVIVPSIFEQDLSAATLLAVPELYAYGQLNKGLNIWLYLLWMVHAAATGIVVWFISWAGFGVFDVAGAQDVFAVGDLCFSIAIVWTNIKLLLIETHNKTFIVAVSFVITVGGWWLWNVFLSLAYDPFNLRPFSVRDGFLKHFGDSAAWWLSLVFAIVLLAVAELGSFVWRQLQRSDRARHHMRRLNRWFSRRGQLTKDEADVSLWQEMEKDPEIRQRLHGIARPDALA